MEERTKFFIDIIYNDTHQDYKGILEGEKALMYWDKQHGTTLAKIKDLPSEEFSARLHKACKTYKVTPFAGQFIIKELNANVLRLTFESTQGTYLGDLYSSPNEANIVVKYGHSAPVNAKFEKHIFVCFD
jgi:hypothetical protein